MARKDLGEMSPAEIMKKYQPGRGHLTKVKNKWSWEQERDTIWSEECKCCGAVGTYQQCIIKKMQKGWFGDPVKLGDDGKVWGGSHRLLAALTLQIPLVPVHYGHTEDLGEGVGVRMVFDALPLKR